MKRDPKVTLLQIADVARHVLDFCAQNDLDQIEASWEKRMAFERAMEILGEAVKRLPPELCALHPEIPWKLVAGMRDRISHGYDGVDYVTLRDAARDDLPALLVTVERMISELEGNDPGRKNG
jgi:uncharacterized protein with HEPN domain